MGRSWWGKFLLLFFLFGLSVVYVYPTLAKLDLEKTSFPFKQKINLGLDLQGGLYMVLGVDFNKVFKDVVERQGYSLQSYFREKGIDVKSVKSVEGGSPGDPRIAVEFDPAKRDQVHDRIKSDYWTLRIADESPGRFELGLARDYRTDVRDRTISQSIEVIRNRIDEFGVTEPTIVSQGEDRLVIELPGVKEIERAKNLIGQTAKLEFQIVADDKMDQGQLAQLIAEIEKEKGLAYKPGQKFSEYVTQLNEAAKGKIPEGTEIAFERAQVPGEEMSRIPYLLYSRVDVTGDDLADASVGFDEQQRPEVVFSMNPKGAAEFGRLTEANVRKRLAIVLDNIVQSAPVINSKITDRGSITLGTGNADQLMKDAKDLAVVLRAGALPAQLEFLEQRVVGPSLGADSIKKGGMAALIGAMTVFLFIMFYYRASGVIAAISLALNALFVLACLVGLEATLTLPGIAGIALTIGMAVDSNIIIYERIREELRAGKRPHSAVEAGFQKAFSSIFDANITTAAAGVVLLVYGTGPIRGFAVTLLIGVGTTLFTAVFVCKLLFEAYLRRIEGKPAATLSI